MHRAARIIVTHLIALALTAPAAMCIVCTPWAVTGDVSNVNRNVFKSTSATAVASWPLTVKSLAS